MSYFKSLLPRIYQFVFNRPEAAKQWQECVKRKMGRIAREMRSDLHKVTSVKHFVVQCLFVLFLSGLLYCFTYVLSFNIYATYNKFY